MTIAIGIVTAGLLYLLALTILVRTKGFQKRDGKKSFLHFRDKPIALEQGVIGLFQLIVGTVFLGMWFYFLIKGWNSFTESYRYLLPHVLLQLITGLTMFGSGLAAILDWKPWQTVYVVSFVFILYSTLVSIAYGPEAHGRILTMAFIGVWSFCIAGIMTFSFFKIYRSMRYGKHAPPVGT